jgi:hypothetical protein
MHLTLSLRTTNNEQHSVPASFVPWIHPITYISMLTSSCHPISVCILYHLPHLFMRYISRLFLFNDCHDFPSFLAFVVLLLLYTTTDLHFMSTERSFAFPLQFTTDTFHHTYLPFFIITTLTLYNFLFSLFSLNCGKVEKISITCTKLKNLRLPTEKNPRCVVYTLYTPDNFATQNGLKLTCKLCRNVEVIFYLYKFTNKTWQAILLHSIHFILAPFAYLSTSGREMDCLEEPA